MADPASGPSQFSRRSRRIRVAAGLVVAAVAIYGGYFAFWKYHLKRFQVVAPGAFYRVAQPTEFGLRHVVRQHGIKTVVSLQMFDMKLYWGLFDPGDPDGRQEADFARSLGLQHVQWPMGDEQCWPWPTPWQVEEFLRLVDDPKNHPILIHCMGGRHRTGTLSALYRLEYDRWSPDRALEEMYSFSFGLPVAVHEYNLRTYVPRPRPTPAELQALNEAFAPVLKQPPGSYGELVGRLREAGNDAAVQTAVTAYVQAQRPFALSLAGRLIDRADDPRAEAIAEAAWVRLNDRQASPTDWESAAALVADFGSDLRRRELLERLQSEIGKDPPSRFYEAIVRGVTNRYTQNRLALLKPLLDDQRVRPNETAGVRYCDTAFVRIAAITDALPVLAWNDEALRSLGRQTALDWFAKHPDSLALAKRTAPLGRKVVLAGEAPLEEDLSKMRR